MKPLLLAAALALALPAPLAARTDRAEVEAILAEAGPGTRWGLVVAEADGTEILAIDPEGRFIPASNTKLFTTAAAMWAIANGGFPDAEGAGTQVRLERSGKRANVVLVGRGDARMSAAADCVADCLAALADAVAAKTRRVARRDRRRHRLSRSALEPGDELEQHPDELGHRGFGADARRQRDRRDGHSGRGRRCAGSGDFGVLRGRKPRGDGARGGGQARLRPRAGRPDAGCDAERSAPTPRRWHGGWGSTIRRITPRGALPTCSARAGSR